LADEAGGRAFVDAEASLSEELLRRFENLSPEDQERVLDLIRRLGADESDPAGARCGEPAPEGPRD
jgi:hypothetical protein